METGSETPETNRECGTCYACCVFLDIEELRKKGGRPCKHLSHRKPQARCSIYARRPEACSEYICAWMAGCFGDDMRPDQSGLLVTMYEDPDREGKFLVTINVTNSTKCGTIESGPLAKMLHWLMGRTEMGISRINLLNRRTGKVVEFADGTMWECDLIRGTKLEELVFVRRRVLGHYQAADRVEDLPGGVPEGAIVLRGE